MGESGDRIQSVALVMVDALRFDYLDPKATPFLHRLAREGVRGIVAPPFGFEPDDAIFAGLSPGEADAGAQFWRSDGGSPFSFVAPTVGRAVDRLPRLLRLACRAGVMGTVRIREGRSRVGDHPTTARIPFRFLRQFDFSQKQYPFEPDYAPGRSLFHLADDKGLPWLFHGFPRHDTEAARVVSRARRRVRQEHRLVYFHISDLDTAGHRWGPDAPELRSVLERVDRRVSELVQILRERLPEPAIMVFGDHGMCSVKATIDVEGALAGTAARPGRDYLYFLDSTMARIWFDTTSARSEIEERMRNIEGLRRLDGEQLSALGANYGHHRFGDAIYQAAEGRLIHPSFYARRRPPRGMHGYGPEAEGDRAVVVLRPRSWAQNVGWRAGETNGVRPMCSIYAAARRTLEALVP